MVGVWPNTMPLPLKGSLEYCEEQCEGSVLCIALVADAAETTTADDAGMTTVAGTAKSASAVVITVGSADANLDEDESLLLKRLEDDEMLE